MQNRTKTLKLEHITVQQCAFFCDINVPPYIYLQQKEAVWKIKQINIMFHNLPTKYNNMSITLTSLLR